MNFTIDLNTKTLTVSLKSFNVPTPSGCCPFADIAQLVEQLIRNEQVAGSSPTIGSGAAPAFLLKMVYAHICTTDILYFAGVFSRRC